MSLRVEEYCEALGALGKARDDGSLTPPVEDLMNDRLDELWNELTVDEVREVEERYPELRVRKFG